jgi:hypothetical protein
MQSPEFNNPKTTKKNEKKKHHRSDRVANAYNPSCLGNRDQEDRGSRPAQAKS